MPGMTGNPRDRLAALLRAAALRCTSDGGPAGPGEAQLDLRADLFALAFCIAALPADLELVAVLDALVPRTGSRPFPCSQSVDLLRAARRRCVDVPSLIARLVEAEVDAALAAERELLVGRGRRAP
jgi:hypothetical protein